MIRAQKWLPVIGTAALMLLILLVICLDIRRPRISLPPIPHPVHVRLTGVADLGAELAAPLFAPTRTLIAPTGQPSAPQVPPPLLSGIVIGGGKAVALVKSANGGETLMLHAGETIDGWTILGLAARQMVVVRDGTQHIVALNFATPNNLGSNQTGSPSPMSPGDDGLEMARGLHLPASSIPEGSPLERHP